MDFSYEVSRSLAACQGVILLVDSSQVQAWIYSFRFNTKLIVLESEWEFSVHSKPELMYCVSLFFNPPPPTPPKINNNIYMNKNIDLI